MNNWTKCSDALPPIKQKVIVAWDNSAPPEFQGTHDSAVERDTYGFDNGEWAWYDTDTEFMIEDWGDYPPTHWMPWPEFKL